MKISKQIKKIIMCIAVAAMLCGMYCTGVEAEGSIKLGMDQYRTENGKVIIYVNHNKGETFDINKDESCVVVGKQNLAIENIQKFKDAGEPVSYMFMVDISGSMSKDRIETVKNTLKEFISTKNNGDNICISTMADSLVSTGFTEDADALNAFVDGIALTNQDTDLYKSIKEELNTLKTDKAVKGKRCLVIFSDGAEDQKGGITKTEAENMVKTTHIPVFTVALLPANHKEKDLEAAKILGSFARDSAGGEHYVPALDNIECKDVNGKIRKIIEDSLIVSANLAEVTTQDGITYLGVKISEGQEKSEDGMDIPPVGEIIEAIKEAQSAQPETETETETVVAKEEPESKPAPAPEKKPAPAPEKKPAPEPEKKPKFDKKIIIIIGAGAVALLAIVVGVIIVLATKKKKPTAPMPAGRPPLASGGGNKTAKSGSKSSAPASGPAPTPVPVPAADKTAYSGIKVTLHKMGPNADETYPLVLDCKRSLGRKKTCDLNFENDGGLSGIHCYIFSKDGKIYVEDNGSTNGTFVNGVPIKGEFVVSDGDVLLVGSSEYRITRG